MSFLMLQIFDKTWQTNTQTRIYFFPHNTKSGTRLLLAIVTYIIQIHFTISSSLTRWLFICRFVTLWCQYSCCSIKHHRWTQVKQKYGQCSSPSIPVFPLSPNCHYYLGEKYLSWKSSLLRSGGPYLQRSSEWVFGIIAHNVKVGRGRDRQTVFAKASLLSHLQVFSHPLKCIFSPHHSVT